MITDPDEESVHVSLLREVPLLRQHTVELSDSDNITFANLVKWISMPAQQSVANTFKLNALLFGGVRLKLRAIAPFVLDVKSPDISAVMTKLSEEKVMHGIYYGESSWIPVVQSQEFAPADPMLLELCLAGGLCLGVTPEGHIV